MRDTPEDYIIIENEKTLFLKKCIADALIKLMRKKDVDKITVDEIVKTAGVGRMTYFRNFQNKIDVIFFKLKCLSDDYYKALPERPKTTYDRNRHFLLWVYKNREIFELLNDKNALLILLYFAAARVPDESVPEEEDYYKTPFFVYGISGVVTAWASGGFKDSPDKILEYVQKWCKF